ncbi:MAG: efflux transporter outer membrane subunit [Syntrophus sp. (in: bacteria)]|nr:efflux transporter outer membrane subunit [Syntrophus sp. (in: bacteria)]
MNRSKDRCRLLMLGILAVLLGGCTLAPKYDRPAPPVPGNWPTGAAYQEERPAVSRLAADLPWWEFLPEERLQKAVEIALKNSRDLRLSALNVERARALYRVQRDELLPSLDAAGSGIKERVPADLSSSGRRTTREQYRVDFGVSSWEIDFFGRIQSLKDRALEEYLATDQARRNTQILLVSEVANVWFALAADGENLALSRSTLEAQQTAYNLILKRYDVGLASELDLNRAQTQVDTARRNVAIYTQWAAQDVNALNLLAGTPVPAELLPSELSGIKPPKEVSAGLSSDVLLNRPDVLAAEHRLKAAHANIGAARAAFFPRISLTTTLGTASADLSDLFKSGQGTWSFGPQIVMPIFDARTWSAYDVTKVEREISVARYEQTIQAAFREVADALALKGTLGEQLAAQQSLVEATANTYRLADARYERGIDSYLSVLDAHRSLYSAQQALTALRLEGFTSRVTLYKVLGGGSTEDFRYQ